MLNSLSAEQAGAQKRHTAEGEGDAGIWVGVTFCYSRGNPPKKTHTHTHTDTDTHAHTHNKQWASLVKAGIGARVAPPHYAPA